VTESPTRILRIAVTCGEPAGIGPDLVAALAARDWPVEWIAVGDPALIAGRGRSTGHRVVVQGFDQPLHRLKSEVELGPQRLDGGVEVLRRDAGSGDDRGGQGLLHGRPVGVQPVAAPGQGHAGGVQVEFGLGVLPVQEQADAPALVGARVRSAAHGLREAVGHGVLDAQVGVAAVAYGRVGNGRMDAEIAVGAEDLLHS